MKVTYYPGCSLKGTARDYQESIEGVCSLLGLQLEELEDWNCCGATAAHSLSHRVGIHLPGRNLALAEGLGQDMLVPCPLCYNRLKTAERELLGERRAEYDVALTGGKVRVWDLANYMAREEIQERLMALKKRDLKTIRAVCYYGCMASRPPRITGEVDYENPMSMDRILKNLGAEVLPWSYKTDCCGASHLVARPDIVFHLTGRLFAEAHRAGANCMVVSCQMCQANLDLHQEKIIREMGGHYALPVFYFTELMGLALGHRHVETWLGRHFVDAGDLVRQVVGESGEKS